MSSIISSLTPAQVAQLSTTAIQSLQTTDIAALSTSQAAALTATQVSAMQTVDLQYLAGTQVASLSTTVVHALLTPAVRQLHHHPADPAHHLAGLGPHRRRVLDLQHHRNPRLLDHPGRLDHVHPARQPCDQRDQRISRPPRSASSTDAGPRPQRGPPPPPPPSLSLSLFPPPLSLSLSLFFFFLARAA